MGIFDWLLRQSSDELTSQSKNNKTNNGVSGWVLRQVRDELAAESKKGNTGILDWVLKQSVDKMITQVERNNDLKSIRSSLWTYRFDSYEDAICFLNSLEAKYRDTSDRQMKDLIWDAFRTAKSYWHKG